MNYKNLLFINKYTDNQGLILGIDTVQCSMIQIPDLPMSYGSEPRGGGGEGGGKLIPDLLNDSIDNVHFPIYSFVQIICLCFPP